MRFPLTHPRKTPFTHPWYAKYGLDGLGIENIPVISGAPSGRSASGVPPTFPCKLVCLLPLFLSFCIESWPCFGHLGWEQSRAKWLGFPQLKQRFILPEPPGGLITKGAMTGTPTKPFVGVVHLPRFIISQIGERVLALKNVLALIVLLVCPLSRGMTSVQVISQACGSIVCPLNNLQCVNLSLTREI